MISAIGRKAQVQLCEDTLTAGVFDTLLLLPHEVFWKILTKSVFGTGLPEYAGPVVEYQFWPNWDPTNTDNSKLVQPDLFLRFNKFDLLIEAKRWDFVGQDPQQWKNEIQAYLNVYGYDKPVFFLAIGGNCNLNPEPCIKKETREVPITKYSWLNLLIQIIWMLEETEKPPVTDSTYSICAILRTAIKYLEIHGYIQMEWLATLSEDTHKYTMSYMSSNTQIFNWKPEEWKYE